MAETPNNPLFAIPAKYLFDPTAKPSPDEQIFAGFIAKDELVRCPGDCVRDDSAAGVGVGPAERPS